MGFEFGMFHEFQCPAGTSQPAAFAESFEQVDAAERPAAAKQAAPLYASAGRGLFDPLSLGWSRFDPLPLAAR